MNLNYHHLLYFWNVVKNQSFTKTSEKLRVSQSTVSDQIRQLEDQLNMTLLIREKRKGISVTDQGKMVYSYAEKIFGLGDELKSWAQGHKPTFKTIRIGALAGLSRNFQFRFIEPLLESDSTKFEVITGDFERLVSLLSSFDLDVILSTKKIASTAHQSLSTHLIAKSHLVLVESSARKKISHKIKENFEDHIFLPSYLSELRPEIEAQLKKEKMNLFCTGEVDDIALLRLLALSGKGLCIIPEIGVQNEIKEKRLKVIKKFNSLQQSFYAIHRLGYHQESQIEELIQKLDLTR